MKHGTLRWLGLVVGKDKNVLVKREYESDTRGNPITGKLTIEYINSG